MTDKAVTFSTRLKQFRLERHLSQEALATRVGVRQTAISQFESGKKQPRLETLTKIAAALDVSTALLFPDQPEVTHES